MIEAGTALIAGSLLPVLPLLLLRTLQGEDLQRRWRAWAWSALAALAWISALYLFFSNILFAVLGVVLGVIFVWRDSRKPRIISHRAE